MDKFGKLLIFFLIFLGLLTIVLNFGQTYYNVWGRRLIFPVGSKITRYPGNGEITQTFDERIYVIPRFFGRPFSDEGKPFFADIEDRSKYADDKYIVYDIQAQDQLLYSIGDFQGWENIEGSLDKNIVLKQSSTKEIKKYRVAFEDSSLFGDNLTQLSVEEVGILSSKETINLVEKPNKAKLTDLTFDLLSRLFKRGDVVVIVPVFEPPELAKRDPNGNFLASWLIIRRVGGLDTFTHELGGLSN